MNQLFKSLFGVENPSKISYGDMQKYFQTEKEESDLIEFKSFNIKGQEKDIKYNLSKTICAFANSSGGILIWGAPQGVRKPDRKNKVFQGDLTPINDYDKDWINHVIVGNLIPLIVSLKIEPIKNKENGNTIFLIYTDESDYAPHQYDSTYYMRLDGSSKPAPHHYIQALFEKVKHPILDGHLTIDGKEINNRDEFCLHLSFLIYPRTKFPNGKNLYIRYISNHGMFHDTPGVENTKVSYQDNRRQRILTCAKDMVFYGEPYIENFVLAIPLGNTQIELEILVAWSTDESLLRQSRYRFIVGKDISNYYFDDFIEIEENVYTHESGKKNLSDDEKIRRLIKRNNNINHIS